VVGAAVVVVVGAAVVVVAGGAVTGTVEGVVVRAWPCADVADLPAGVPHAAAVSTTHATNAPARYRPRRRAAPAVGRSWWRGDRFKAECMVSECMVSECMVSECMVSECMVSE
jgi:hypothetical protein